MLALKVFTFFNVPTSPIFQGLCQLSYIKKQQHKTLKTKNKNRKHDNNKQIVNMRIWVVSHPFR